MGAASRRKGAAAERELAGILAERGVACRRNLDQPRRGDEDARGDLLGARLADRELHVEAKRQERLDVPAWLRQLDADCPPDRVGVLAFRQSRQPWRVVLTLDALLDLVGEAGS